MKNYYVDAELKQINIFDERWYNLKFGEETLQKMIAMLEADKDCFPQRVKDFLANVILGKASEGLDLPSVTTYLDAYPKGFGYELWLQQVKDPYAIRDEAGALGSDVHNGIESVLKGGSVEFNGGLEYWERMILWSNFWKEFTAENKIEFSESDIEKTIYSVHYEFAGTCDLFATINGVPTVIDWKTGSFVGDSAEMQVSAYAKALEEMTGVPVPQALILQFGPKVQNKKKYKLNWIKNIDTQFEDFLHVQYVWKRYNKNAKPKYKIYPTEMSLESILQTKTIEVAE